MKKILFKTVVIVTLLLVLIVGIALAKSKEDKQSSKSRSDKSGWLAPSLNFTHLTKSP